MNTSIHQVTPRDTVEVHLPDQGVLSGPRGSSVGDFLQAVAGSLPAPAVGAVVNGELRELTYLVKMDCALKPVTMADADGVLNLSSFTDLPPGNCFYQAFPTGSPDHRSFHFGRWLLLPCQGSPPS